MAKDPLHTTWLIADKFREIDDTIPIRWIQTFLYVAQREDSEDLTQARIGDALGCAQGVVSKFLRKMSDEGEGLGLLRMKRDPLNDSRKTIELTPKGRKLLEDIKIIVNKG